jgi:anti-sigma B factor antagonist
MPVSSGDKSTTTVRCEGDLDIVTSDDVKRQLAAMVETGTPIVTLDLGDVRFVDSSGLGALVAVHHFAEAKGAQLVVKSPPDHVRNLFNLTRLDNLLTVV